MATGRPGRVTGTYEEVGDGVALHHRLRALRWRGDREIVSILRVIHTARDWPNEEWPR
jgi:plasmid stabilization system protein ParE